MIEWWPAIVFGWPMIIAAIALGMAGIVRSKANWLIVTAVAVTPFSLYLAATPRFRWVTLLIPLLVALASVAVRKGRTMLAWLLLMLPVSFIGWLAVAVYNQ